MDTLVLNNAYMPIDRVSWFDAISDLFAGRAEVVDVYEDRVVRSGTNSLVPRTFEPLRTDEAGVWKVPSIIRFLTKAVFRQRCVRFNRHNVWLRDRGKCQYCNHKVTKSEFTLDHVLPRSRDGKTKWTNVVVSCLPCNHRKANRTPVEAGMKLCREPVQPMQVPGQLSPVLSWHEGLPSSWKDFMESVRYWHTALEE